MLVDLGRCERPGGTLHRVDQVLKLGIDLRRLEIDLSYDGITARLVVLEDQYRARNRHRYHQHEQRQSPP